MKFLLQTIEKKIVHDFGFALIKSKEFMDWSIDLNMSIKKHEGVDFSDIKNPDKYTPVGSVDFVSAYLNTFYPDAKKMLEPLNVPDALIPFAGRDIMNIKTEEDLKQLYKYDEVFAKSLTIIKHPENGFKYNPNNEMNRLLKLDNYDNCVGFQVSSVVEFLSEWRVFVFNGKILDCKNYMGDFFTYPDSSRIIEMVMAYKDAPVAYTLDVGVIPGGETVVIECHRFFSCGLYGFDDIYHYPYMLSQEWFEMKNYKKQ
jgi:hypothetical protein